MRGSAVKNIRQLLIGVGATLIYVCTIAASPQVYAQSSSTIKATVCWASSAITLSAPVGDSVVTDANVIVKGTIEQANQIEVSIDDGFDKIIPLSSNQTTFDDTLQLTPGTHTIKFVAINTCPGPNGSVVSVVTYTPPPQVNPSSGTSTPTSLGSGVSLSGNGQVALAQESPSTWFHDIVEAPLQRGLTWLNIDTVDSSGGNGLPLRNAIFIAIGTYLLTMGLGVRLGKLIIGLPFIARVTPWLTSLDKLRWFRAISRILGLTIIIASLL